ncbi:MAG: hypothetical protein ABI615_10460, partial [Chthoniobacterales bacterium]
MKHYSAPWGRLLWIMSTLTTVVIVTVAVRSWPSLSQFRYQHYNFWVAVLILLLLPVCLLFVVRGYSIGGGNLFIQRLLWKTAIPLANLQSVQADPAAMRHCIRTCGNGGAFSFTGLYWNKNLG